MKIQKGQTGYAFLTDVCSRMEVSRGGFGESGGGGSPGGGGGNGRKRRGGRRWGEGSGVASDKSF